MEIIFVGGVHGSGKSRFCAELAPIIRANHHVASDLLGHKSRKGKAVGNVRGNQEEVLLAVDRLKHGTNRLLLDGHFCLLTTAGDIRDVPIEYFRVLAPKALFLVEAQGSEIQDRLARRDGTPYPPQLVKALLQRERSHAFRVKNTLCVPLKILTEKDSLDDAAAFLTPLL